MRQAGEPSVEEILASIKKVIARDTRLDAPRADAPRAAPRPRESANPPAIEPTGDAALRARFGDVLDLGEIASQVLSGEPRADHAAIDGDDGDDAPLLDQATAAGLRDSLAALAMLAQPGVSPQIVRSGETSVEGLVREMLRPMLAQWLDAHLPPLVERLVAAEITRIVRKQG